MAYSRNPTWQNSPSVATPITAAALENIEAGLVNAAGVADSSITALAGKEPAISRTGATTGQVATLQAGGTLAFAPGVAGATGPTGATGTSGTAGATGTSGTPGTAATVTAGTTTTGAAGTSATVTNSGTASAATFNFVIPQGVAGSGASNATTTTVGSVQLAGDLAGTAVAPTVPGLATKAPLLIPTVVKTTAYTAVSGDLVRADATTASFAVTLPAAAVGGVLAVKKVDSSVNTITITPAGTDTIDGLTTAVLRLPNATQRLIAVAGGWVVADGFNALTTLDARYDAAGAAATREVLVSRTGATTGQVPVLQAGGTLAFATPAAGGSGPAPNALASGEYTGAYTVNNNSSPVALGYFIAAIGYIPAGTYNVITLNVTTVGTAGALGRMGVYERDTGNLVVDSGTVDVTTTGQKAATISFVCPGGYYWIGAGSQGAATTQAMVTAGRPVSGFSPRGAAGSDGGAYFGAMNSGALTNPLPTKTPYELIPAVLLRKA